MKRLVLAACTLVVLTPVATAVPAGAQDDPITWWALGDSYSSGEGIPGTEPPAPGQPECARASGNNTSAKAWAVVAREKMAEPRVTSWAFTPCTGATSSDVEGQMSQAATASGTEQADIVTLSMGGNDILFADVIRNCIDIEASWNSIPPGCSIDEATLRNRIDMLVGSTPPEKGKYSGITLPTLYDRIADKMRRGGAVIVLGYPQIIEEVSRWAGWRRKITRNCEAVQMSDVAMLRSVAGYLNQQIALAVQAADARWSRKGIRFHWRDIATGVYETGGRPDQRHALCSSKPWLNGLSIGITSGDFRTERSFHPTQEGHTATGTWLGNWMRSDLGVDRMGRKPESPGWDEIKDASIPAMCGHPPATLVDGKDTSLGPNDGLFELLATLPNGEPGLVQGVPSEVGPLTAVVVTCNAGGVGWPNELMFFEGEGEYYAHTDLLEGVDWESAGLNAPGRDGVTAITLQGDELEVHTSALTIGDPECCPSGSAVLRLRVEGGGVRVTSVQGDQGD